jgi:signal transduction histidine kinase
VDLGRLVDESFSRLQETASTRGVTLERDPLEGVCIYADPVLIARVIDNTIANAVHYNRDGGRVSITAHLEEPPPGAWVSPTVHIEVHDTGGGIPSDEHERIFERFFRLDYSRARHTGGSGLGLAISREVLTLQGGTIRVGASSPAGTTIEIRIPGRGGQTDESVSSTARQ